MFFKKENIDSMYSLLILFLVFLLILRYFGIFMALTTILIWVWVGLLVIIFAYDVKSGHFAEEIKKKKNKQTPR
ncbi:hypothetical protein LCGC14_0196100 [marine sediment metagenome]|uniref:Uncharacterized protein n=1 Tax=marine sediment metagenome TaxID=412755 RepID=A0A0F9V266_9ZZZZ